MPRHTAIVLTTSLLPEISAHDAACVRGGAGVDFNSIRQQAAQVCPTTAAKFAHVDPAKVTRTQAQAMGNACLAEMSPLTRVFAKGAIEQGIEKAFPAKK